MFFAIRIEFMMDIMVLITRKKTKKTSCCLLLLVFSLLLPHCGSALNSKMYDIRKVPKTNPDIRLQMGDEVILNYPQVSRDLIGKFNIGEFAVIDFSDQLYQEFIQQLKSRGVIIKDAEFAGDQAKVVSIAITDFEDKGIPEYDFSNDQDTSHQWDNREINNGRVGYYPECYDLRGSITLQYDLEHKVFRVEKVGSNFSYARSTDLIENLQMFVTAACNELFLNQ